jgi:hypothetical protein
MSRDGQTANLTENLTRKLRPCVKRCLESTFPGEDCIRSLYLLRAIRVDPSQVHLLATLPASVAIIAAAIRRLPAVRTMLAPHFTLSLTLAPSDWQIEEISRRYELDYQPKAWAHGKRSA